VTQRTLGPLLRAAAARAGYHDRAGAGAYAAARLGSLPPLLVGERPAPGT
jgi:hypothetical protein